MGERPIAIVTPRHGPAVVGGSEAVMAEVAAGLAARGRRVEVVTTCARSHYTWEDELPAGAAEEGGLLVRRFPVVQPAALGPWIQVDQRMQRGEPLAPEEELAWASGRWRSPAMHRHLVTAELEAAVFSPYLAWSTLAGVPAVSAPAVVMPCFHDEPAARLRLTSTLLQRSAAAWFLSEPERDLAQRLGPLGPRPVVTGAGVHAPPPDAYDPEGFRRRHGLERPFALYAGRRELLKGWDRLADWFLEARSRLELDLDLVTFGANDLRPDLAAAEGIVDLGQLPAEEVPSAFAAALVYVQPSRNESFSRTLMEAWLAGTPVLADAAGAVVAWHVQRSGAGATFSDGYELGRLLQLLAARPDGARALGAPGRAYVLERYGWDRVLDAMEASLDELAAVGAAG